MTSAIDYAAATRNAQTALTTTLDRWKNGVSTVTDQFRAFPTVGNLPQVDVTEAVERQFAFIQQIVDLNHQYARQLAEVANTLTGVTRQQIESVSSVVRDQVAERLRRRPDGRRHGRADGQRPGRPGRAGRAPAGQGRRQGRACGAQGGPRQGPRALRGPDQGRAVRAGCQARPAEDRHRRRARRAPGRGRHQVGPRYGLHRRPSAPASAPPDLPGGALPRVQRRPPVDPSASLIGRGMRSRSSARNARALGADGSGARCTRLIGCRASGSARVEHADAGSRRGRRAGHERGAEPEAGEPDHAVGRAELERHPRGTHRPGSKAASTCRRSPDSARISMNGLTAASSPRSTAGRPASGWSRSTTATSGSSVSTGGRIPAGDLVGEQADEREVEVARAHLLGHVPAPGVLDGDLHAGMAAMEGDEGASPRAARRSPTLPTMPSRSRPVISPENAASSARATSTPCSSRRACGSSSSPAGASRTDRLVRWNSVTPVLAFQPGDLVAQRRLHHVAPGRGPREVALLGDADEVLELAEIHLEIRSLRPKSCLGQIDGPSRDSST